MNKKLILNGIGFQLAWWSTVLGVINGIPYLGPLVMSFYLLMHLKFIGQPCYEIALIITAGLIGTLMDTVLNLTGLVSYQGTYPFLVWAAPLWITTMWMGFAATLNHGLSWLTRRPWLGFILGAVFGPLAYLTGARYGAIQITGALEITLVLLALLWGLMIPALSYVSKSLKQGANHAQAYFYFIPYARRIKC